MTGWAAGWVDKWICGQAGVDPRPAVGVKVYEITARESLLSWLHHWRTSVVGSPGLAIM